MKAICYLLFAGPIEILEVLSQGDEICERMQNKPFNFPPLGMLASIIRIPINILRFGVGVLSFPMYWFAHYAEGIKMSFASIIFGLIGVGESLINTVTLGFYSYHRHKDD